MSIQVDWKVLYTFYNQNYQLSECLIGYLACRMSVKDRQPTKNKWKKECTDEQPNDGLADRPSDQMINYQADKRKEWLFALLTNP